MASLDLKIMTSQERREALRTLLSEPGAHASSAADGAAFTAQPDPAARHEPFPLTPIQQAYWLGRDPAFTLGGVGIHGYFELECTDLDVHRLQWALNATIQRHEMLRAVVLPEGRARILERPPLYEIAVEDLRDASPEQQEAHRCDLRARMSHQVFDVTQWPLFEIRAVRLSEHLIRLHYSEDAIHIDLASSAIVTQDWIALYRDPHAPLAAIGYSYRDYACAVDAFSRTQAYRRAQSYWRARLADLPDIPELPLAKQLADIEMRFVRHKRVLPREAWRQMQRWAAQSGLTPSDVLLAAYADVLGTWSAKRRFLLNVTIQNRLPLHPQVSGIAGDFTSFTLLDVDTAGADDFRARAARYRDRLWQDLEHPEMSGVEVLRELARQRGGGADFVAPYVFTSALGTNGYRAIEQLGAMAYEVTQTPQVLIDQQVLESDDALVLTWDAVEAAFPPGLIAEMFEALWQNLLRLSKDKSAWEAHGPMPIPAPQRAARVAMNATGADFRRERLESVFSRTASERGDAPAIFDADGVMSYAELDLASSRVAAELQSVLSARTGDTVAIAIAKGRGQVIAVLGILKAGAAYLPLDVAQPRARVQRILRSASCDIVMVDESSRNMDCLPDDLHRIVLEEAEQSVCEPYRVSECSDAAAYVLFTSGSTGEPKGVAISHDSVLNRMQDVVERFAIGSTDRAFALTALHHDLSVFDVFGMLAVAGGAIAIPAADALLAPQQWWRQVDECAVTVWNSVPSFLDMWLGFAEVKQLAPPPASALALVLVAGDFIPCDLPARLRRVAPQARFVSLGGPTETAVWDICYPFTHLPQGWDRIPYGRPMRNATYHILREDLSECPDWVCGEMYIGGAGLGLGYVGDPSLTAQRFITHPQTAERLYRSGDKGRMRPDGLIEILGRMDRQVKLRGHRIELSEVEAALRRHPQVSNAVVCLRGDGPRQRLVAIAAAAPRTASEPSRSLRVDDSAGPSIAGRGRRSARGFTRDVVPFAELAALLAAFADVDEGGRVHRRYPSAGERYAVEMFVCIAADRVGDVPAGLYRFDAERCELELCSGGFRLDASLHATWNAALATQCAFTLLFVAELDLLDATYGRWARDLCLVESGYMGQLAMCVATELGLDLCPIGGLEFAACRDSFPIGSRADLVHCMVGGYAKPVPAAAQPAGPRRRGLHQPSPESLRRLLREELPPYMLPATIIVADALPLTSNGKVDRAQLDALIARHESSEPPAVCSPAHADRARRDIAAVLGKLLGRNSVPEEQALHELGASSIHIVQLHTALSDAGYRLDVTDLFRFPSVAALATFLAAGVEPVVADDLASSSRLSRRQLAIARSREMRNAE